MIPGAIVSTERTLPHNIEAEKSVFGAILVSPKAFETAIEIVQPRHFYRDAHRRIYEAIVHLVDQRREVVDMVTLKNELQRRGDLDEVGGPAYVASLADGVPRGTNVLYYAGIVKEQAALRDIIYAANRAVTAAYEAAESADLILARTDRELLDIQNGNGEGSAMVSLRRSLPDLMADFEQRIEHKGALRGVPTGFAGIDEITMGWQAGDMVIFGARPSIGKTALLLNTCRAAAEAGHRVGLFSMEMKRQQLEYRLLSNLTGIPMSRLLSGHLGSTEYPKISKAMEALHALPIEINDRAGLTVHDIRRTCRRMKSEGGLGLVGIDYIQLMQGTLERRSVTRNEELSDISRRLKVLFGELGVPGIVLSQLARKPGRPTIADLRDCGALEQDADLVGLLHRSDHRTSGTTEFILAKQRNGRTGTNNLTFDLDTVTFTDGGEDPPPEPEAPEVKKARKRHFAQRGPFSD